MKDVSEVDLNYFGIAICGAKKESLYCGSGADMADPGKERNSC